VNVIIGISVSTVEKETQLACSAGSYANCNEAAVMGEPRAYILTQAKFRTVILSKAAALPESGSVPRLSHLIARHMRSISGARDSMYGLVTELSAEFHVI
jgi:hypothetical protein